MPTDEEFSTTLRQAEETLYSRFEGILEDYYDQEAQNRENFLESIQDLD